MMVILTVEQWTRNGSVASMSDGIVGRGMGQQCEWRARATACVNSRGWHCVLSAQWQGTGGGN